MIEYCRSTKDPVIIEEKINTLSLESPHYKVGKEIFFNRIDAIEACVANNVEFPTFTVWPESLTMSEPPESFLDLCKLQAKRIRNKFKRVRIWYSGGYDSHTMLKAFFDAGLDVDEICIWRRFPAVVDNFTNIEVDYIDTLQDIQDFCKENNSTATIKVLDVMPHHYRFYSKNDKLFEHNIKNQFLQQPFTTQNHGVLECYPELIDNETVNIHGGGDPIQVDEEGFVFIDIGFNYTFGAPNMLYFFCNPDMPEIMFKFAYVKQKRKNGKLPDNNIVKKELGYSALNQQLGQKWANGLNNEVSDTGAGMILSRKTALFMNNAFFTFSGRRSIVRYKKFYKKYNKNRKKFLKDVLVYRSHIGAVSEKHFFKKANTLIGTDNTVVANTNQSVQYKKEKI